MTARASWSTPRSCRASIRRCSFPAPRSACRAGTTTELNLADYFKANKMEYNPVVFEKLEEVNAAYDAGRCDVYTTDQSGLYAHPPDAGRPDDHVVLPEIISKEPLGPAVRQGDDQWFDIVKWTYFALLNAEELGITQANVDEMKDSRQPGDQARPRPGGRHQDRHRSRPRQRLGRQHRQGGRQLRRDLRAQCRLGQPAEDRPRHQRPVDQGRPAIRACRSADRWSSRRGGVRRPSGIQSGRREPDGVAGTFPRASQARVSFSMIR